MNWFKSHWGWFVGAIALFIGYRLYTGALAATAAAQADTAATQNTASLASLLPTTGYPSTVYSTTAGTSNTPSDQTSTDTLLAQILAAQTETNKAATAAATSTTAITSQALNTLTSAAAARFATQSTDSGYINSITGSFDPTTGSFSLKSQSDANAASVSQDLYSRLSDPTRNILMATSNKFVAANNPENMSLSGVPTSLPNFRFF